MRQGCFRISITMWIHFQFHNKTTAKTKKLFWSYFSSFQQNFQNPFFPFRKAAESARKMILGRFFQFSAKFPKSIISFQKSCRKCGKMILSRKINVWFKFTLKSFYSLREVTFELKKRLTCLSKLSKNFSKGVQKSFSSKK